MPDYIKDIRDTYLLDDDDEDEEELGQNPHRSLLRSEPLNSQPPVSTKVSNVGPAATPPSPTTTITQTVPATLQSRLQQEQLTPTFRTFPPTTTSTPTAVAGLQNVRQLVDNVRHSGTNTINFLLASLTA